MTLSLVSLLSLWCPYHHGRVLRWRWTRQRHDYAPSVRVCPSCQHASAVGLSWWDRAAAFAADVIETRELRS